MAQIKPCRIPLTKGKYALVDADVYDYLTRFKWCITAEGYAKTGYGMYMHRMLTGLGNSRHVVDHVNHNTLDNRMINLKVCRQSINLCNVTKSNGKSSFRGVYPNGGKKNPWSAQFKHKHLGCFKTEELAAEIYQTTKLAYMREFSL